MSASLAWVDESGYDRPDGASVVLAAVRCAEPGASGLRTDLNGLLLGATRALHWRDEGDERRRSIITVLNSHQLRVHVVMTDRVVLRKKEAARSQCLHVLLRSLEVAGVTELLVESRQGSR